MQVVILGAGGHGKVVLDIVRSAGQLDPVGFLDADPALTGSEVAGLPVLGTINFLPRLKSQGISTCIVAIGDNLARQRYMTLLRDQGLELGNAIHPSAYVASTAELGVNVVVAPHAAVITESHVGDGTIVNTSAVIEHECRVGSCVHLAPGAIIAGRARVEDGVFIGMGAKIIQCRTIGKWAVIGAGAVVLEDIPPRATAVGVPAKVIKTA